MPFSSPPRKTLSHEKKVFWLFLFVGLLHGVIYVFLIPPWDHYDEPGHFDYAWLVANRPTWPQPGEYDNDIRLEVRKTFYNDIPIDPSEEVWIGLSQVGDPPLYYFLVSIPLRLMTQTTVINQLYAGRLISLVFFLLTIWAGFGFTVELTSPGSHLRWMVPAFLAMLPGLAEFMTALNNYAAAICLFSFWLWIASRLIRQGPSWLDLGLLLFLTIICFYTQKAVWLAILLFPLVILLTFIRKYRLALVAILSILALAFIFALFDFKDSALWLRQNYEIPTRTEQSRVSFTPNALKLEISPDQNWGDGNIAWPASIFQFVPPKEYPKIRGKPITVGAWMWSDRPITAYGPGLNIYYKRADHWYGFIPVELDTKPTFKAFHTRIPDEPIEKVQIWLRATTPDDAPTNIYLTGVVFTTGYRPLDKTPRFTDLDGKVGKWGGKFTNLARNPMIQQAWPYFRSWFHKIVQPIFNLNPTSWQYILSMPLDLPGTTWYLKITSANIFRSFWAKFGWGNISLSYGPGVLHHPYRVLLIITLIGIIGYIISLFKDYKKTLWTEITFYVLVISIVIGTTYAYGILTMGGALRLRTPLPVARYIYPAIVPIAFILTSGWQEIFCLIRKVIKISGMPGIVLYVAFLLILDIYAVISVVNFYT